jgi:hypothetical protein
MWRIYWWQLGWSLLTSSILTALLGVVALLAWQSSPMQEFQAARARWADNPLPHYRLVIERPSLSCQQDVEIINEQIVNVIEHNCPIEMLTMTDLYERIDMLDGQPNFAFFPSGGCGCMGELNAHISYHPELGYPQQVGIADRRVFELGNTTCWRQVLTRGELPECDLPVLFGESRITNISLTPLP